MFEKLKAPQAEYRYKDVRTGLYDEQNINYSTKTWNHTRVIHSTLITVLKD